MKALKIKSTFPTEHEEQVAFVKWFRIQFPHIRIFAIPNGIRTGFKQAIKAKNEGMSAGVPDLFIPEWGVWLEQKRQKGSVTSPEQKDWHRYLEDRCGHKVIIAYGCTDGVSKIMELTRNK